MADEELVQVKIRVRPETHRRLKMLALRCDVSVNELVNGAIEHLVGDDVKVPW